MSPSRIRSGVVPLVALLLAADSDVRWRMNVETDPFSDATIRSVAAELGQGVIWIRCTEAKLEAFVDFDDHLGSDNRPVIYRFDRLKPVRERWRSSSSGSAVFSPQPAGFARGLARANQLAIEVIDFRGGSHRAVGALPENSDPIEQVMNACGVGFKVPPVENTMAAWRERAWTSIQMALIIPPGFRSQELKVRVAVELDPWGHVSGEPKIIRASGNPWYDESVIRAVQKASPLPPPPDPGRYEFDFSSKRE